jgi:hypothetical protein
VARPSLESLRSRVVNSGSQAARLPRRYARLRFPHSLPVLKSGWRNSTACRVVAAFARCRAASQPRSATTGFDDVKAQSRCRFWTSVPPSVDCPLRPSSPSASPPADMWNLCRGRTLARTRRATSKKSPNIRAASQEPMNAKAVRDAGAMTRVRLRVVTSTPPARLRARRFRDFDVNGLRQRRRGRPASMRGLASAESRSNRISAAPYRIVPDIAIAVDASSGVVHRRTIDRIRINCMTPFAALGSDQVSVPRHFKNRPSRESGPTYRDVGALHAADHREPARAARSHRSAKATLPIR